jgi:DNA ligase-1
MLAEDWDSAKQQYPVIAMPKIDGVRALNQGGQLYGRSLKQHANRYVTKTFSLPEFDGFDGEMAAASSTSPRLVNLTSSALSTEDGEPFIIWWLFDYVCDATRHLPYEDRLLKLHLYVQSLKDHDLFYNLRVVPSAVIENEEYLLQVEKRFLEDGYEGVILRDPDGRHKEGRSTVKEGGFMRIKRFVIEEAFVYGFEEAVTNNNEAKLDERGYTKRSSHKANLVGKGQVGTLLAVDLKSGQLITVGPGKLKHGVREHLFNNPHEILGTVIKYKHFPKGVKDKPRFPTYESGRALSDLDPTLLHYVEQLKTIWGF